MNQVTHLTAGAAATLWIFGRYDWEVTAPVMAASLLATALPDLDHPNSWLGRSFPDTARWLNSLGGSYRGPLHVPYVGVLVVPPLCALVVALLAYNLGHQTLLLGAPGLFAALLSYVFSEQLALELSQTLRAAMIGFVSHIFLDHCTPEGLPLSLRGRKDGVIERRWRLPASGSRFDRRLGLVCLLLLWPFWHFAERGAARVAHEHVQQNLYAAMKDYEILCTDDACFLEGRYLEHASSQHISGKFPIVTHRDSHDIFVVETADETGRRRLVEVAGSGGQWRPIWCRVVVGAQVRRTAPQSFEMDRRTLLDLAGLSERENAYVSGELLLFEEAPEVVRELKWLDTVRTDGRAVTLDHAPWRDIAGSGIAGLLVRDGTVYVRQVLKAGKGAASIGVRASEAGEVVTRSLTVARMSDVLVAPDDYVVPGHLLSRRSDRVAQIELAEHTLLEREERWIARLSRASAAVSAEREQVAQEQAELERAGQAAVRYGSPQWVRLKGRSDLERAERERSRAAAAVTQAQVALHRTELVLAEQQAASEEDLSKLRAKLEELRAGAEIRSEVAGFVVVVEQREHAADGYRVRITIREVKSTAEG